MEHNNHSTNNKSWKQISEADRYKIEAWCEYNKSAREIAEMLGKSKRTIEREIKMGTVEQKRRNANFHKYEDDTVTEFVYRADYAQRIHDERAANKGRNLKIGGDHALVDHIEKKIREEKWSPDAVIGDLREKGNPFEVSICTKTLYSYIDRDLFLGISNKDLLYKKNKENKKKQGQVKRVSYNNRKGMSIEERPEEVNSRGEKGHWEIDLVVGKQKTKAVILTLVERKSRKSIYVYCKDKTQKSILKALRKVKQKHEGDFEDVFKTITADNGPEFLDADGIKKACGCDEVYYAHPYSSWERGSNENGNRILRRFVPKGIDISEITQKELQRIEDWVNNYPRKILGYKTANEVYYGL